MDPLQEYSNAISTPLVSGSTSPTTVVTPKLARTAINQIKMGLQAVNQAQTYHRSILEQQGQIKKQEDYQTKQDNYKVQQDQQKLQMDQQQMQKNNQLDELSLLLKNG